MVLLHAKQMSKNVNNDVSKDPPIQECSSPIVLDVSLLVASMPRHPFNDVTFSKNGTRHVDVGITKWPKLQ